MCRLIQTRPQRVRGGSELNDFSLQRGVAARTGLRRRLDLQAFRKTFFQQCVASLQDRDPFLQKSRVICTMLSFRHGCC